MASGGGATLVSANAAIMDLLGAVLFLGKCGGLKHKSKVGVILGA